MRLRRKRRDKARHEAAEDKSASAQRASCTSASAPALPRAAAELSYLILCSCYLGLLDPIAAQKPKH